MAELAPDPIKGERVFSSPHFLLPLATLDCVLLWPKPEIVGHYYSIWQGVSGRLGRLFTIVIRVQLVEWDFKVEHQQQWK